VWLGLLDRGLHVELLVRHELGLQESLPLSQVHCTSVFLVLCRIQPVIFLLLGGLIERVQECRREQGIARVEPGRALVVRGAEQQRLSLLLRGVW
jgi:hypothetical protein